MRTRIVVAIACALAAAGAVAQAPAAAQRIDLDSVAALVATVAGCAALHSAAADALERGGLAAYADVARRRAEVDQLTAMFLVAEDRVAKGGARRDYMSYASYVEDLTAAARAHMAAIVTLQDIDKFTNEEDFCASLVALEDETLAKINADTDARFAPGAALAAANDGNGNAHGDGHGASAPRD
jgi:hypothetical protein